MPRSKSPVREAFRVGEEVWVVMPSDKCVVPGVVTYDFNGSAHVQVTVTLPNGRKCSNSMWHRCVFKDRTCAYDDYITLLEGQRSQILKDLNAKDDEIRSFKEERDNGETSC